MRPNPSRTSMSAYCAERLIRGRRRLGMMGPRSPIIKSGPQAISCGQREVLAAMARLAKVIVPTRVPTLPSRYRNGGCGSGLLVVPDEPDGDSQLRHWHRCIPVGQSIDDRSRLDRAMPRARSRSVNLPYGAKRRSAAPKSVAWYACPGAGRDRLAGWVCSNRPNGALAAFFRILSQLP